MREIEVPDWEDGGDADGVRREGADTGGVMEVAGVDEVPEGAGEGASGEASSAVGGVPADAGAGGNGADAGHAQGVHGWAGPGPNNPNSVYCAQYGKGRPVGSKNKHPQGHYGIERAKRRLKALAKELSAKDSPDTRKQIRRTLEVISLYHAARSEEADSFIRAASLAVDLSGYKIEAAALARAQAAKKAQAQSAKADTIRRQKLVEKEQERGGKEETF